jgi:nitroreductase
MFTADHDEIRKAIHRAQHCQRNWDLTQEIPKEDLDLFIESVTQCPSKQNIAHYRVHAITNRSLIEQVHHLTDGFTYNLRAGGKETQTNTQVLANLLLVFEGLPTESKLTKVRNTEVAALVNDITNTGAEKTMSTDAHQAVGVAAGFVNVVASLLGYGTGCCACFDHDRVQRLLKLENPAVLLMGIGFKQEGVNRRVHHKNPEFVFPTMPKQNIEVVYYN